jgi:hypothetical protein
MLSFDGDINRSPMRIKTKPSSNPPKKKFFECVLFVPAFHLSTINGMQQVDTSLIEKLTIKTD